MSFAEEALHDEEKLEEGALPIWQTIDPDPKARKDSDGRKGLHILEMVQFANAAWVAEANHGMKKDMEDQVLLFPDVDVPLLGLSKEMDAQERKTFDTFEDCTLEIEALKAELTTIVWTETEGGRERWDTPAIKGEANKGVKLRKDRYSALLMANMTARTLARARGDVEYHAAGGWAGELARAQASGERKGGALYVLGEGWIESTGEWGAVVAR